MLEEGNIIYFTPFYFKNGKSTAKPKYFIVLKANVDNKGVLASLPTRLVILFQPKMLLTMAVLNCQLLD